MVWVREATPADAPAVLRVHRAVLGEGRWFITRPDEFTATVAQLIQRIGELQRHETSTFLVGGRDRAVEGFVTVQGGQLLRMRHVGKLEILVHADARGQGLGKALLDAALEWAEAHAGVAKIGLNVFADNRRAIALYERAGFAVEGRRLREYRMEDGDLRDDLLMYRFT